MVRTPAATACLVIPIVVLALAGGAAYGSDEPPAETPRAAVDRILVLTDDEQDQLNQLLNVNKSLNVSSNKFLNANVVRSSSVPHNPNSVSNVHHRNSSHNFSSDNSMKSQPTTTCLISHL